MDHELSILFFNFGASLLAKSMAGTFSGVTYRFCALIGAVAWSFESTLMLFAAHLSFAYTGVLEHYKVRLWLGMV